jgi:HSP20 family molecular chaperone IbpA
MTHVTIREVENGDLCVQPVFEQMECRREAIRSRAFELFELRGGDPGHATEDWLKAERELLGWPPLETQESDSEFEFHVPLDDFEVSQVEIVVTPWQIIVHARADMAGTGDEPDAPQARQAPKHVYRRIELAQPINTDRTSATLEQGTLRITAPKVQETLRHAAAVGA